MRRPAIRARRTRRSPTPSTTCCRNSKWWCPRRKKMFGRTSSPFPKRAAEPMCCKPVRTRILPTPIACARSSHCKASNPEYRKYPWTTIPGTGSVLVRFPSWTNSTAYGKSCARRTWMCWSSASATRRSRCGRRREFHDGELVTEWQRQVEARLSESEERFRGAFESAAIGMALVAPDGRWLRVNRSLCRIVGYTAEELLATNYQSITHPDDLDTDVGQVRQMLDGSLSHYDMEKRYLHRDGHIVWVLMSVSLVRDAKGQSMYFVSQIQDITDRKLGERRLIESELRYRTVADLVPGFVFEGVVRDGYPHPTWVSDGFERVYGCTLGRFVELGGKSFYDAATWAQMLAAMSAVAPGSDLGI